MYVATEYIGDVLYMLITVCAKVKLGHVKMHAQTRASHICVGIQLQRYTPRIAIY